MAPLQGLIILGAPGKHTSDSTAPLGMKGRSLVAKTHFPRMTHRFKIAVA